MSLTALKKLVESSKATVLVGVAIVMAAMVYFDQMTVQQFLDTVKVLVPTWMLAHAGETGAKHLADGRGVSATEVLGERVLAAAAAADKGDDNA